MRSNRLLVGIIAAAPLWSAACWQAPPATNPDLAPVTGMITLNGKPLERAFVLFQSVDSRPSSGMTDHEGRYELMFDHVQKGALIGGHVVSIVKHYNPALEKPPKRLPTRYNDLSELKIRVVPGENVFNFDLVDDDDSGPLNEAATAKTGEPVDKESLPADAASPDR